MHITLKNLITLNLAWINTAFSVAFRSVEVPFVLYFVAQSINPAQEISVLGSIVACWVMTAGLSIPLATVVIQGINTSGIWRIFCVYMGATILLYFGAFFVLYSTSAPLQQANDLWFLHIISLISFVLVGIRRLYMGALIQQGRTQIILVSSFFRIISSIVLAFSLPTIWAGAMVGFLILSVGGVVELSVILLYCIWHKIRLIDTKTVTYISNINYLKLCTTTVIFMSQNYIILGFLSIYNPHMPVSVWVVVYAFMTLSMGLCMDISNIVLQYRIFPKHMWKIFTFPFIVSQILVGTFLYTTAGRHLYFTVFQKMDITQMGVLDTLRLPIAILLTLFINKEICKGFCLIYKSYSAIMVNSIINIGGLCIVGVGVLLYMDNTYDNTIIGLGVMAGGIISECLAYAYIVYKNEKKRKI